MDSKLRITWPVEGDILGRHDGTETPKNLNVNVTGSILNNALVKVNGHTAVRSGRTFEAKVQLEPGKNRIVAETADERCAVDVFWSRETQKRFRLSCDDNILFLKDLGLRPERYPNLFDHWYLSFWRSVHREFGAKVHLNIYYQTDGFDLTQLPETWRETWDSNASWLHLSFHALQDKPDRPYRNAGYCQLAHDYDLVTWNIRRFAGHAVLSNTTTVHWAECPAEGVTALRDRGIDVLVGIFAPEGDGTTGYYLTYEQNAHVYERGVWHDLDMGVTFVHADMVVNAVELNDIVPRLESRAAERPRDAIELLIHEQYFRKELSYFQPDVCDKVRTAVRWAVDNGYEPDFWSDDFVR